MDLPDPVPALLAADGPDVLLDVRHGLDRLSATPTRVLSVEHLRGRSLLHSLPHGRSSERLHRFPLRKARAKTAHDKSARAAIRLPAGHVCRDGEIRAQGT